MLSVYFPPQQHNMQIIIIDLFLKIILDVVLRDLYTTNYSFKKKKKIYIYIYIHTSNSKIRTKLKKPLPMVYNSVNT